MKSIYISKPYRLYRSCIVLGILIDWSEHIHLEEDTERTGIPATNKLEITIESLLWGIDISKERR